MKRKIWFKLQYKWHRLTHWEFWPLWAVYLPCIFYYVWISLKSRSFGFFKAVNPSILHGGMTLEDKHFVNQLLPQKCRAKSFFIHKKSHFDEVLKIIKENNVSYPIIAKPNNGYRGRNVELIQKQNQLENYLQNYGDEDLLLEEYIDLPNEIGVFYIKIPSEKKGFISGIVEKKGVEVSGDGKQNLGELVKYNFRYHHLYSRIFSNNDFDEKHILKKDEKILLSTIGNHSRGSTFYDSSDKITPELENLFNEICFHTEGFYYGRFDVKFSTWKELENGENFKIIELNGAASEPAFIYDPKKSYLSGIKEIVRHWDYMYQIAKINKQKGHHFTDVEECWDLLKEFNPFSI